MFNLILSGLLSYYLGSGPKGTEIYLIYPSGEPVKEVTLYATDETTESWIEFKKLKPTNPIGEVVVWEGKDFLNGPYYLVVCVLQGEKQSCAYPHLYEENR